MVDKMGYDRSITMFSPDGRLLQVEYAKKTVKQGSTAIAIACKDGVVFVVDKRVTSKLLVPEAIEKMFVIDDHVAAAASGIISANGDCKNSCRCTSRFFCSRRTLVTFRTAR